MEKIEWAIQSTIGYVYEYKVVKREYLSEHLYIEAYVRYFKTREQAMKYLRKQETKLSPNQRASALALFKKTYNPKRRKTEGI